jgi:hypothetical protein
MFLRNISPPSSGSRVSKARNQVKQTLAFFFYRENGGKILLRNFGIPPHYTALQSG